jgi:two-component system CheB/CheR fusion protein
MLTEILQRTTTMPVVEALDQITVKPNAVYVIPPNRDVAIFHGNLQLSINWLRVLIGIDIGTERQAKN